MLANSIVYKIITIIFTTTSNCTFYSLRKDWWWKFWKLD